MVDNDDTDEKIIAIPFEDPTYNSYRSIEALPGHIFSEMQHFFQVYKELEGKDTAVREASGQKRAIEVVKNAMASYDLKYGDMHLESQDA
jgi:inorganic pyrophosphatase